MLEIRESILEFLFDCEANGLSPETVKNYGFNIRKFGTFLFDKDIETVDQIEQKHLKQFVVNQRQKGFAESYINTQIGIMKVYFKYLYKEGYIEKLLDTKKIKKKKKVIETFSDNEIRKILNACQSRTYIDLRDKAVIYMLIDTGLRNGEVCRLKESDIKQNNVLLIRGKGNKERYVPFSPQLKKVLMKYERAKKAYFLDRKMVPEYYFVSRYGQQLTRFIIQDICKKIGRRAGVTETKSFPHNYRHAYSVQMLKNGLDLYSLSRTLGHADITTTSIYTNSIKDEEVQELALKSSPLMNIR